MPDWPYGQRVSAEALPSIERAWRHGAVRAAVFHGREHIAFAERAPLTCRPNYDLRPDQRHGVVNVAIRP